MASLVECKCVDCGVVRMQRPDRITDRCRTCANARRYTSIEVACVVCGKVRVQPPSRIIATCKSCTKPTLKHGHCTNRRPSLTQVSWSSMLDRCRNPNCKTYPAYGGAGIAVCERWLSFQNFLADMGERPSRAHTIDRIENGKGYEPGNCRWATRAEQNRNRRRNVYVVLDGQKLCVRDAERQIGLYPSSLSRTVRSTGATHQQALDYHAARLRGEDAGAALRAWGMVR